MDESIRHYLSQIQMERMELKSSMREISFLMELNPNKKLTQELDRILDRLEYLDKLEKEFRSRM